MEAIDIYVMLLGFRTNNVACILACHRELIQAYQTQERLAEQSQLKLHYFDLELESVDRVLYYTDLNSVEAQLLVSKGP